ncbi:MAG: hypothetical protein R6U59_07350, partial [Eubacteriales bacterium]
MAKIIIIGIGTKKIEDISLKGYKTLRSDKTKFLRTDRHPFAKYLKEENIQFNTFDKYFQERKTLEEVYETIIEKLKEIAKIKGEVYYYVPGSPYYGD